MATFIGEVIGNRGGASRTGSKDSGLKTTCRSYDGSVITRMRYDREDRLQIDIELSDDSSYYGDRVFYGTLEELKKIFETAEKIKNGEYKIVKKRVKK